MSCYKKKGGQRNSIKTNEIIKRNKRNNRNNNKLPIQNNGGGFDPFNYNDNRPTRIHPEGYKPGFLTKAYRSAYKGITGTKTLGEEEQNFNERVIKEQNIKKNLENNYLKVEGEFLHNHYKKAKNVIFYEGLSMEIVQLGTIIRSSVRSFNYGGVVNLHYLHFSENSKENVLAYGSGHYVGSPKFFYYRINSEEGANFYKYCYNYKIYKNMLKKKILVKRNKESVNNNKNFYKITNNYELIKSNNGKYEIIKNKTENKTENYQGGKKPITKKHVIKKPTPKKLVTKKPVAKKSATKKPTTKKLATKKLATKKPVTKKPVTKKPVAKKPATKKPTTKKPTTKKSTAKK